MTLVTLRFETIVRTGCAERVFDSDAIKQGIALKVITRQHACCVSRGWRRRDIVARLAQGPRKTRDAGGHFGFTKQALGRHISLLEGAGLVSQSLQGRTHELTLVPDRLDGVVRWITELRRGWATSLDRLDEVLRAGNH